MDDAGWTAADCHDPATTSVSQECRAAVSSAGITNRTCWPDDTRDAVDLTQPVCSAWWAHARTTTVEKVGGTSRKPPVQGGPNAAGGRAIPGRRCTPGKTEPHVRARLTVPGAGDQRTLDKEALLDIRAEALLADLQACMPNVTLVESFDHRPRVEIAAGEVQRPDRGGKPQHERYGLESVVKPAHLVRFVLRGLP